MNKFMLSLDAVRVELLVIRVSWWTLFSLESVMVEIVFIRICQGGVCCHWSPSGWSLLSLEFVRVELVVIRGC
jgi:hypothetical protein